VVAAGDQHVGRLDVAVHEAARVRGVQGRADLADDPRGTQRLERALGHQQPAQVRALDQPHRDEQDAVLLVGLEDRDDVRVVDRGGRPGPGGSARGNAPPRNARAGSP
jgi:hypothetical protein